MVPEACTPPGTWLWTFSVGLLVLPLVRNGNLLTIGLAEQDWKIWTAK